MVSYVYQIAYFMRHGNDESKNGVKHYNVIFPVKAGKFFNLLNNTELTT